MESKKHKPLAGKAFPLYGKGWSVSNLPLRLLLAFAFLVLFAKLVEDNILFSKFNARHARKVQKVFLQKEQKLLQYMDMAEQCTYTPNPAPHFTDFHEKNEEKMNREGLYVFIYYKDTLSYWSSSEVAVDAVYSKSGLDSAYVSLNGGRYPGRYASFIRKYHDYTVAGLVLIKNIYTYENKYLKTSFQKDFNLPPDVKIFNRCEPDYYPITNSRGEFMWALIFDGTNHYRYQIYVPAIAYLLAIICFLVLLNSLFRYLRSNVSKNICLPLLALLLYMIRRAMQRWHIPSVFYEMETFDPVHFASEWFPSLGDLGLWCLFICFFILELYRHLRYPLFYERRWKYFAYLGMSLIITVACFFAIELLIKTLIVNSLDIFEGPSWALLLNRYSSMGFLIIMLFLTTFCLLLDKTVLLGKQELTLPQFLISCLIVLFIVLIAWSFSGLQVNVFTVLFLAVTAYVMARMRLKKNAKYNYSRYVLIIFILSAYISVLYNHYSFLKHEDRKKVLVTNLASQHDLTAELFLRDISEKIKADTMITDIAYTMLDDKNDEAILAHIKRNYFYSTHWNRFLFQCIVCENRSDLIVEQRVEPSCVGFFRLLIDRQGTQLPRSEFYYINRLNIDRASSYLGWFRKQKDGEPSIHIFIELWIMSDGDSDELGYPELLLDSRISKRNSLKGYSYAKYHNHRRVSQSGNYKYNLTDDIFRGGEDDYHIVHADGMEHLVYHPDENNIIVLSSYSPGPGDLIFNFSYIFIFSFLLISLCLLIFYLPVIKRSFQWNFRNKIQYMMITIILVSFAIIGIGTVFYINRQYMKKNIDIVDEKMRAIHAKLSDEILLLKDLDKIWTEENIDILTRGLIYFKDMFFTDINLFDVNGQLITTSLPDIYERGLTGRQINPNAYVRLEFRQRASILEYEKIGSLDYLSVYEPFTDENNKVIAFLNLPYFTHQDALTEEISNVIIAVTNFYMVIILLTVIISIVMSNQITQPLMMLQDKFRNIKLGEKNEPVSYKGNDEIGALVKEYNRAIDELAKSANKLARSERESAWREMAKQIAHEINNPLTPMKLSIQHLKRAYDNRSERFDQYMEKISTSLVEQIDTLSSIATEFSNFAKMPAAHNEPVDIISVINNVVPLYATGDNKRAFHSDFHGLSRAVVYADKEQMSRVFINLLKNALQAIPKNRKVDIHIDILKINRIIWVRIKDNGLGIPEEMQGKIFRPNFTTKSSGMGMGLAIVQNIIESVDGTINFKTRRNEGTTFIISLPAIE
jgi:signal transduction histidine kinase